MFDGHFPKSLWLCKYEKKSYDLKIHQDAPYILAISLCVSMCVHCLCVHVCARVNGCTHVCACMFVVCAYTCVWVGVPMYVSICACVYRWVYSLHVCACMCVGCTHAHVCAHVCTDGCVQIGVCVHYMCVHMCGGVPMCVNGYAHMCVFIAFVCAYVCMCVQMDVHTCVCAHICVSALSGAHIMEPYCQNNAILTTGISKDIRSGNSVTCRETLSRSRIKYTMSPGSLQATRQKELPASQCRWPSRRHSRRLSSVDQPVNPSSFHGFVCFSCEGK